MTPISGGKRKSRNSDPISLEREHRKWNMLERKKY
jgi:hypothetical protein